MATETPQTQRKREKKTPRKLLDSFCSASAVAAVALWHIYDGIGNH